MAKIRLNKEKREILRHLAAKVVADTPVEKETEIRLKKAEKELTKTFKALCDQAKKELAKAIPQEHIDVCKKYGHTSESDCIHFMNLDSRSPFSVQLANRLIYDKQHDPDGTLRTSFKYDERSAFLHKWNQYCEAQRCTLITGAKGTYQRLMYYYVNMLLLLKQKKSLVLLHV